MEGLADISEREVPHLKCKNRSPNSYFHLLIHAPVEKHISRLKLNRTDLIDW